LGVVTELFRQKFASGSQCIPCCRQCRSYASHRDRRSMLIPVSHSNWPAKSAIVAPSVGNRSPRASVRTRAREPPYAICLLATLSRNLINPVSGQRQGKFTARPQPAEPPSRPGGNAGARGQSCCRDASNFSIGVSAWPAGLDNRVYREYGGME
jgi:hypothetical protein